MYLHKLIERIQPLKIVGVVDDKIVIKSIVFDSRKVTNDSLFVAIVGSQSDGHDYINKAQELGASAIICQRLPESIDPNIIYILVEDSSHSLAIAASEFYGNPSSRIKLVGVTGTNGKTTIATVLHDLCTKLGHPSGLISTVVNKIGEQKIPTTHTTPDPVTLNELLHKMLEAHCHYCFMEISSHSVVQKRIDGLTFAGGIFTNLTHDHLDYHHTFAEYIKAKKGFFDSLPKDSFTITNIDDRNGLVMTQNCKSLRQRSYSLNRMADYHCKIQESTPEGMLLDINNQQAWMQFVGKFNAYNLTAIYATAVELGFDPCDILRVMSALHPVSGRMECVRSDRGILGIVDYAHTPDALENVLRTIEDFRTSGSHIITVVGCGGDRDATKRPIMARIAAELSDRVILTSDNPRTEDPGSIISQMHQGLNSAEQRHKTLMIESRREAIRTAVALASDHDIILVAGKGHETYQDVNGIKSHFDDKEELRNAFEN